MRYSCQLKQTIHARSFDQIRFNDIEANSTENSGEKKYRRKNEDKKESLPLSMLEAKFLHCALCTWAKKVSELLLSAKKKKKKKKNRVK